MHAYNFFLVYVCTMYILYNMYACTSITIMYITTYIRTYIYTRIYIYIFFFNLVLVLHSETNLTQVANIMDTISFICNITGSPISSIKIGWTFMLPTHDDRIEINTVTNDNYVVSNLTIKLIQPSDAGLYRCTASLEGIADNISFKLIVGTYVHMYVLCSMYVYTYLCMHVSLCGGESEGKVSLKRGIQLHTYVVVSWENDPFDLYYCRSTNHILIN